MNKLLGIIGIILLIVAIILNRTHAVDSGISLILGIIAGILVGKLFEGKSESAK